MAKVTSKVTSTKAAPGRTQEPKITGILVRDPLNGPRARRSRPGLIWSRGVLGGEALYFHENPAVSHLPHPVGSKEFRRMLDEVKLDEYGAKAEEAEPEKEPAPPEE